MGGENGVWISATFLKKWPKRGVPRPRDVYPVPPPPNVSIYKLFVSAPGTPQTYVFLIGQIGRASCRERVFVCVCVCMCVCV